MFNSQEQPRSLAVLRGLCWMAFLCFLAGRMGRAATRAGATSVPSPAPALSASGLFPAAGLPEASTRCGVVSQSQAERTWWPWGHEAVTTSLLSISQQPYGHFDGLGGKAGPKPEGPPLVETRKHGDRVPECPKSTSSLAGSRVGVHILFISTPNVPRTWLGTWKNVCNNVH